MTCSDIALVSDAWYPQINGVVRTLDTVRGELTAQGRHVTMLTPDQFFTLPCPSYPEIRLSVDAILRLSRRLDRLAPRHIHIATEGPLGIAARRYCRRKNYAFTTSFHTKFPEYIEARLRIPSRVTYRWLQRFHAPASAMLVTTASMMTELGAHGFNNCRLWTRGVDSAQFYPGRAEPLPGDGPHFLYVGRVATEKNLPAFLDLDLPGTKHVVGDGPMLTRLREAYPGVYFAGALRGEALRRYYAMSDVFVFPSLTDTFGLVMLEALACGTPVAAFPVTGPNDIITDPNAGCLHHDLQQACMTALVLNPADCLRQAERFSWAHCAKIFADTLVKKT
ncbi:MAG: glycosyltransferase family 4 protein [Rickettsiales bacterium]